MCCRSDRCFRINCHCICQRCKNCTECERQWGGGGIGEALAGQALAKLAYGIHKKKKVRVPPPAPPPPLPIPPDPDIAQLPPKPRGTQGGSLVKSASDGCIVQ